MLLKDDKGYGEKMFMKKYITARIIGFILICILAVTLISIPTWAGEIDLNEEQEGVEEYTFEEREEITGPLGLAESDANGEIVENSQSISSEGDTIFEEEVESFDGMDLDSDSRNIYKYVINDDGETITVKGFNDGAVAADFNIPSVIDGYTVTSIAYGAFYKCELGGEVVIPNSVTSIGDYAFFNSHITGINIQYGVKTIGAHAFDSCKSMSGKLTIPNSVTQIGEYAFYKCSGLNGSLTISNGIKEISSAVFMGCSRLQGNLTIPDGVTNIGVCAFESCSGFSGTLTIPNSVTFIGGRAFEGCSKLTGNLSIPSGVTSIENSAFHGCSGLKGNLSIPSGVTSIGDAAFFGCSSLTGNLFIPSGVTSIGNDAFSQCSGLTGNLFIPSGVTSIGNSAFSGCSSLTGGLSIPSGVTSIGNYAFSGCSGLTGNLSIPSGVTSIGNYAFSQCSDLIGGITIPNGVTSIGEYAFSFCDDLTGNLFIPSSVTHLGEFVIKGCNGINRVINNSDLIMSLPTVSDECWYDKDGNVISTILKGIAVRSDYIDPEFAFIYELNSSAQSATIVGYEGIVPQELFIPTQIDGYDVEGIGAYAFFGCGDITGSLTIPSGVTRIGDHAFEECSGLKGSLTIPNSVTNIGDYAFYNCNGLTGELTIPNSVISMGDYAFANCRGLTGNLVISSGLTRVGNHAFEECSGLKGSLTIPNGVANIGDYAFYNCNGLTGELIIPNSVTSMGDYAFANCSNLIGNLVIPNGITSIGNHSFEECCKLTGGLTISKSATRIGDYAFYNCYGLTGSLVIPSEVTYIGDSAFSCCKGLTGNLIIPNKVTSIGDNAFIGCDGFTGGLTIPSSVKYIGQYAFSYLNSMKGKLIIEASAANIKSEAFFCCAFTGSVVIPNGVSIGYSPFMGCNRITSILISDKVIADPNIKSLSFDYNQGLKRVINNSSIKIYLPKVSGKTWVDEATKETITSINKGTALRSDYVPFVSVTFDSQGGTSVEKIVDIEKGDTIQLLAEPSKEGVLFAGWFTKPNGQGTQLTKETPIEDDITVYAYWKNLYVVTFDSQGGTDVAPIENIEDGTNIEMPTDPIQEKMVFKGWYTQPYGQGTRFTSDTPIVENITVYAYWKNLYTVIFDSQGGTDVEPIENVEDGTIIEIPTDPIQEKMVFKGWYTELNGRGAHFTSDTPIVESITLYAYWKNLHKVTFDTQGGSAIAPLDNIEDGTEIELPTAPVKEGMIFKGWYSEENGQGIQYSESLLITDNTVLYAYWKNLYSVIFDVQGGTDVASIDEVEDGTKIELPAAPTKTGMKFKGWYTETNGKGTEFTQDTKVIGNTTLYAYWKNLYSVTFDVQGGTDIPSVEEIEDGTTINLPNAPTQGGLLFDGWYSEPEGNGAKFTEETIVTDNITVYANWKVKKGFDVYGIESEYEYTGQQIKPKIYVYKDGVLLSEGSDYSVIYKNNINVASIDSAKSPNVIINGKGNYSGSVVIPFSIVPKSIGDGTEWADGITFSIADKQYNGKEQKSKPTIKFGKLTLKENRDYSLNYSGNLYNCGEVNVLITAKDGSNFVGSAELTYSIYKQGTNLSSLYIPAIPSQTYCGVDIDLTNLITVRETKSSSDSFIKDIDYTVSYVKGSNRRNVGTATILLTGISDRCIGSKTVTFKIVPKAVSAEMFEVEGVSYNGTSLKPEVAMKDVGVAVDASNYTVSYSKNVDAADVSAKNAPTATIKGKGNYTGTVKIPFSITPLELTAGDLDISMSDIKDNGKAITEAVVKPVVKYANPVTGKTVTLKKGKDYSIDYSRGDDDNNQTAKIILKGNYANKQGDDIAFNFRLFKSQTVLNTEDFSVEITDSDITYTGSKITPAVTVNERTEGEPRILQEGKDFTVSYSNNINAADKDLPDANVKKLPTVKITGKGLYKGTVSKTFTIGKKVLSEDDFDIVIEDVKCNPNKNQIPKVTITNKAIGKALKKTDYTVEVKGTTMAPKEAAEIVITGQGNYGGEPLNLTFRVYEKSISSAVFEKIENQSYTGDQICPDGDFVKIYADKKKTVKLEESIDYRLEHGTNVKTGTGTISVIGLGKYGGTKKLTFKIVPMKLKL